MYVGLKEYQDVLKICMYVGLKELNSWFMFLIDIRYIFWNVKQIETWYYNTIRMSQRFLLSEKIKVR